jgi:selenium metabolism protein YedF
MKKEVNAIGDICPIPLVKAKEAIKELNGAGTVEVLVDNEIAVQNLTKMAQQKDYGCVSQKVKEQEYKVTLTVGETQSIGGENSTGNSVEDKDNENQNQNESESMIMCTPAKKNTLVVISSNTMGAGDPELGKTLIKGFIYALAQQDELPDQMLFYNGGAYLTCEGSPSLEDLKSLEEQGVEIRTCGTCLNFYGLTEKLQVGEVTNMYDIVERMSKADRILKP